MNFPHVITEGPMMLQSLSTKFTTHRLSRHTVLQFNVSLSIVFVSQDFLADKTHSSPLSFGHHRLEFT